MENNKSFIKYRSSPYGVSVYVSFLVLTMIFLFLGIFLLPEYEGIALLVCSLLCVLYSLCLRYIFKYMNYITITEKTVATKNKTFSWNNVCLTMTNYNLHKTVKGKMCCIFFDDHYLCKEEIGSKRVKKDAFYLVLTQNRLDHILKTYNKEIKLLDRCYWSKKLYDKVCAHNNSLATGESSN